MRPRNVHVPGAGAGLHSYMCTAFVGESAAITRSADTALHAASCPGASAAESVACRPSFNMQGNANMVCHMAIDLRCLLLTKLRRTDVKRYGEFCDTRDLAAGTICAVAAAAATTGGSPKRSGTNGATQSSNGAKWVDVQRRAAEGAVGTDLHLRLARMRAAERRLAEPDEVFWNAAEHAGAALSCVRCWTPNTGAAANHLSHTVLVEPWCWGAWLRAHVHDDAANLRLI